MEISKVHISMEMLHNILSKVTYPTTLDACRVCKLWKIIVPEVKGVRDDEELKRACEHADLLALANPKYKISGTILDRYIKKAAKRNHYKTVRRLRALGAFDWDRCIWGSCEGGHPNRFLEFWGLLRQEGYIPKRQCLYYAFKGGNRQIIEWVKGMFHPLLLEDHLWCLYGIAMNGNVDLIEYTNYREYGFALFETVFIELLSTRGNERSGMWASYYEVSHKFRARYATHYDDHTSFYRERSTHLSRKLKKYSYSRKSKSRKERM